MKRILHIATLLLLTLFATDAFARPLKGQARDDPAVASGVTISSFLIDGTAYNNIDSTVLLSSAFSTTSSSPTVTVAWPSHGLTTGNYFTLYNSSAAVGGLNMDGGWKVASTPNGNSITFTHTNNATSTVATTGTTTATKTGEEADGKLRFGCFFSHLAYDDPILFPGRPGATHLHLFFGNTLADYSSTYASLRASGNGTCDGGPINRTAYWMPAMIDSNLNMVRIPIETLWYYVMDRHNLTDRTSSTCSNLGDGRAAACPTYAIKRIERGMRAIFGFQPGIGSLPPSYGPSPTMLNNAWTCLDTSGNFVGGVPFYRYLHHRTTPSLGLSSQTLCPSSGQVQLRLDSPNCWDGTRGTNGFNHFAFQGDGDLGKTCPATHPYRFLTFTFIVWWNYTGGISSLANWYLSSDRHSGANFEAGESIHWDMLWGWEDAIQDHWSRNVHGMFPSPYSDSPAGGPYIYSRTGALSDTEKWVGGPFMRNENSGGLSGNASIGDCTALGRAGMCAMKSHTTLGIPMLTDQLVAIPAPP